RRAREVAQRAAKVRRRVGEPCAVKEHAQPVRRAEVLDRPQLFERVARAELRGLGDGDNPRLGEVLVSPAGQPAGDQVRGELSAGSGHGEELGPEYALGSAALVGIDVRGLGADYRLMPAEQQAEPEYVGAA